MTARERGFLLLSSHLGEKRRNPLTTAQLRNLADRIRYADWPDEDRNLEAEDLISLGYGPEMADRIVHLLTEDDVLDYYLKKRAHYTHIPTPEALYTSFYTTHRTKLPYFRPACIG